MTKRKILFVGEHPVGHGGNSGMLAAVLGQLDREKYEYACFVANEPSPHTYNPFVPTDTRIISACANGEGDFWGVQKLAGFIQNRAEIDAVVMVGIDLWRYAGAFDAIVASRERNKLKWVGIFPYDLWDLREDWAAWARLMDAPCVYSKYGYDMLKESVPNVQYFRPQHYSSEFFHPYPPKERLGFREKFNLSQDQFVFGFVGRNMLRKDIPRLIEGFMLARERMDNLVLYLHTECDGGAHNLREAAMRFKAETGYLLTKETGKVYNHEIMGKIYNALDCYVNCSLQEGLSWTVLEAMECGIPVIASDSTAHKELLEGGGGLLVEASQPVTQPLFTQYGDAWLRSYACDPEAIATAMIAIASDEGLAHRLGAEGLAISKDWLAGADNINTVLGDVFKPEQAITVKPKHDKVLFVQHSAAGDVLMSTQCFKGIREKHPGFPFVYMTQAQFRGVIEGHPLVDEIVDWDVSGMTDYAAVYNPHGYKILPGGWNNLDVKLYSMYPYFCEVEADEIYIDPVEPEVGLPDSFIVVHTAGGSKYRVYEHMDMVIKGLRAFYDGSIVQAGGATDKVCMLADLDLRGKTTFRETAWLASKADCGIVIDSFMSHLLGAVGTKEVVLYGPAPARVVGPRMQHGARLLDLQPDMLKVCNITSHCWGTPPPGRHTCMSPCINSISPQRVINAVRKILYENRDGQS